MFSLIELALKSLANLTILYVGTVLLMFILIYGTRRWRKYPGGRAVMNFVVSLEVLIILAIAGNWLPDWQGWTKEIVRVSVYGYIAYASTQMLWTLFFRWQEVVDVVTGSAVRETQEPAENAQGNEQGENAENGF